MKFTLWTKTVGQAQWLLAGCTAVLFGFCWLFVWLTRQIEMSRFQGILELLRPEVDQFAPVPFDHLITYPGRIAVCYDHPLVFLTVAVWAIARGSDAVSGPLGAGTLEMVLAQPVSRLRVLLTHATVTVGGVAVLALAAWAGTSCGVHTVRVKEDPPKWRIPGTGFEFTSPFAPEDPPLVPISKKVDARVYGVAAANLFALGVFLAGFATLVSSCDRYRWRTIGIVSAFFVVQMIIKVAAISADELHGLVYFTFMGAYEPQQFVSLGIHVPQDVWSLVLTDEQGRWIGVGPLGCNAVLVGTGLASYTAAALVFTRRDLPAPL